MDKFYNRKSYWHGIFIIFGLIKIFKTLSTPHDLTCLSGRDSSAYHYMERKINWLHFTDLHYGQKNQNILLPKLKKDLFRDIEYIKDEIGRIDVVFFTGDLTYSGRKEEFDALTVFLKELWGVFNAMGSNPYLIAIPGNHDLLRPDPSKAVVKVLKGYGNDEETRRDFWDNLRSGNEYYELVCQCFVNFTEWYKTVSLPKPKLAHGLLPGDISTVIEIDKLKLGIVGLNTAFLELGNGDYKGKLALNPIQLLTLTDQDPFNWLEKTDLSILLTHHDDSWFDKESKSYYNSEINPPEAYYTHMCGHLHTASYQEYGQIGSIKRRTQLGPSLFGLEKINDEVDRIHGYFAGSYIFTETGMTEHFYPRKALKMYEGHYNINADLQFSLNKKFYAELFRTEIKPLELDRHDDQKAEILPNEILEVPSTLEREDNLFSIHVNEDKTLEGAPRVSFPLLPQHSHIRVVEQKDFVRNLSDRHYCWLITDWGLSEEGFIGSSIDKLQIGQKVHNFTINCEDIVNESELLEAFKEQTGLSLQQFCSAIATLEKHLLVFNHINVNLYQSDKGYIRLMAIIKSITDYCPNTYVVLITRQVPAKAESSSYIRLAPLDAPQVKSYIEDHSNMEEYLIKSENLSKLIDITSGLPAHIDRFMENLRLAPFDELVESEKEISFEIKNAEPIPKSLQQTIINLSDSNDKMRIRSFKLLKILTILSYGETILNLKRFLGSETIHFENARELEQLALLEILSSNRVLSQNGVSEDQSYVKILRVPRQIRDYVNTMITDNEREEILKNACNLYFGTKWREGNISNIKNTTLSSRQKYLNIDNCQLIVKNLLFYAIKSGEDFDIERSATLAVNYCQHVQDINNYKNAQMTAEEIYYLLKDTDLIELKATICMIWGEALRMNNLDDQALTVLNEALSLDNGYFSNGDRNLIYTDLAYIHLDKKEYSKVVEYTKLIEKTTKPTDVHGLTAKYLSALATLTGHELLTRLRTLERGAKRINSSILANNISITITKKFSDSEDKIKRLSKIAEGKDDDYNIIRAIIAKSLETFDTGDGNIVHKDLMILNQSYAYLYGQKLEGLFEDCHRALWLYCEKEHFYPELLNLFRHSSFVWRITGRDALEKRYYDKLIKNEKLLESPLRNDEATNLSREYFERRRLEIGSK